MIKQNDDGMKLFNGDLGLILPDPDRRGEMGYPLGELPANSAVSLRFLRSSGLRKPQVHFTTDPGPVQRGLIHLDN